MSSHNINMAEFGLLTPIVNLFVTEIWKPIKKHIGYCLKVEKNVHNLTRATDGLKDKIEQLEEKIQSAEGEGKILTTQAKRWRESAHSVEAEADSIKSKYSTRKVCLFGCSWNCWFNYKVSRAAVKEQTDVEELQRSPPQNDSIFSLLPPVGRGLPLPSNIVGQDGYIDKVLDYIGQGKGIIGICGMGGTGKSTLLKQVNNHLSRAAEKHEFDHVIFVEVGMQINVMTIQQGIASQLGLLLSQDGSTISRAASICNFLKERKFLLLIDDLYEDLDLVKVGIPQCDSATGPQNRHTIVITTRSLDVCGRMHTGESIVKLECLKSSDAWDLFKVMVGEEKMKDYRIKCCAEKIVAKCAGLPLAIQIVAKSMASKVTFEEWEYISTSLEASEFREVPGAYDKLFSVLKISYDYLSEDVKQCFLFHALTHYHDMYVIYAIDFWIGHELLGEGDDIDQIFLKGHHIIEELKRACLLEAGPRGGKFLQMHDIVRDMALWIVTTQQGGCNKKWLVHYKQQRIYPSEWSNAERIALVGNKIDTLPSVCKYPNLLTLILRMNFRIRSVPVGFFPRMLSLTYLDLCRTGIEDLPPDVEHLTNLKFLDISRTPIRSLPIELKQLNNLRYLNLELTSNLNTIPNGIISGLQVLRVLNIFASPNSLKAHNGEYITELQGLTRLICVGFSVHNFDSLRRICTLTQAFMSFLSLYEMEDMKSLHVSPALLSQRKAGHLQVLALLKCLHLKEVVIGQTNVSSSWCLSRLDELSLKHLPALEQITWKGVRPYACLPRLRIIVISECHGIKTITWIKQLPCLEEVSVASCNSMAELVTTSDEDGATSSSSCTNSFPRLKLIGLSNLENLEVVGDDMLTFPSLARLLAYKCPMLKKLPSKLLNKETTEMVLGEKAWWEEVVLGHDPDTKNTFRDMFRELPTGFQGTTAELTRALTRNS